MLCTISPTTRQELNPDRIPDQITLSGVESRESSSKIARGTVGNVPDHMTVRLGSSGDIKKISSFLRFPAVTPNRKMGLIRSFLDSGSRWRPLCRHQEPCGRDAPKTKRY